MEDLTDLVALRKLKDLDDPGIESYRIQKEEGIAEDFTRRRWLPESASKSET